MPKIKSEQKSRAIRLNEEIEKAPNKKFTQDDLAAICSLENHSRGDGHFIKSGRLHTDYILRGHCKNCEKYIHESKIQHNRIAELMSENSKLIEKISYLEKLIRPK